MTFVPSRKPVRKTTIVPAVAGRVSIPHPVEPRRIQAQHALHQHTMRPVGLQRQLVRIPLRAAALERQEVQRLQTERQALQAQLASAPLPTGAVAAALERQIHRARPTAPAARPVTPEDWVTVLRTQAEELTGKPLNSRQVAQFTALQRQVAQTLAQGFRSDRGPATARYGTYGAHLAALQRHPTSAPVAQVVLGLVPVAERLALQRAMDDSSRQVQAQEVHDGQALHSVAVQRQLAELDAEATQPILQRIEARRGGGNPLPEAVRRHLEQGLNHDLSRVRIHDDAEADNLAKGVRATAFTTGTDIFFRSGQFRPNTRTGLELLAHEVTHTVQQSQGRVGKGIDPDAGLEGEARTMGAKLARVMPSPKSLLPPSPYAAGVYSPKAALQRIEEGAARTFALKPLQDLQPRAVQRLGNPFNWAADKVKDGAQALADKGKEMIAGALTALPGYKELTLAFGKDLVTGKTMAGNPNAILEALAGWVPGPLKDILVALKETNAIPKAWAWFKAELGKLDLGGALGEVASAIGKADLGAAKTAVTRRIGGLKALIVGSARKIADIGLTALAAGLGPIGQQVVAQLRRGGDLIVQVLKNPAKFAGNLLNALKGGFKNFASHAPKHLQNGLGQWLTGASGITFPAKLDFQGVFLTALSVMGLTYQAMRGRLVRAMGPNGEKQVQRAEGTLDTLKTIKGGLHKADEMKANQGPVGNEVVSGLKSEVTKSVVMAGITKVASMLIPGGGFVQALIGAFRSVQFVVQQGQQIMGVVASAVQSVGAIAAGNIAAAVSGVENTLARSIPVALGFLGKVLGLGNIGARIKAVIGRVRGKLDALLDRVVARIGKLVEKFTPASKQGKQPTRTAEADKTKDHDRRVDQGLKDIPRIEKSFSENGRLPNKEAARNVARAVKGRHRIFKAVTPRFEKERVLYDWVASQGTQPGSQPLAVFTLTVESIRKDFWKKAGRPGWTTTTRVKMSKQYPQHHVQVSGVTLPTLKAGYDRRHIDAFDQTVTRVASEINHMTFDDARAYLTSLGFAPAASTAASVRAALKKFLAAEFNKVDNLFVDEAAENQEKGRQMEAAEQRRASALRTGDQATADRETQLLATQAVDVPAGQPNGRPLSQAARGQIQTLSGFSAAKYAGLRGHIVQVKAGTNTALQPLWQDAQIELEAVRNTMPLLSKFSKKGTAEANAAVEAALRHATVECRILADIMDGK